MKKKLPPKKKFPFYAKVAGGNARSRPDRAAYRRGGSVSSKADAEPIDPNEPHAPAGGKVEQKFQAGGGVQLPGSLRSESTELAKARRGFEKAPKDVDAARKMIRTEDETGAYLPTRATGEGRYKDGGSLSAAQRQSLPSKDFALPGKGEGPKGAGSGSYPIPDRSHAANALARSSGKPVAAQVRAKVRAKYPDMGQK